MSDKLDSVQPTGPHWEICAAEPGCEIVRYLANVDEVLDYCGRLLYGNRLFELDSVTIRRIDAEEKKFGDAGPEDLSQWTLQSFRHDQQMPNRVLRHDHDLFGMLIAELRQGATHIVFGRVFHPPGAQVS